MVHGDTAGIFVDKRRNGKAEPLAKKIRETRNTGQRHESGRPTHELTEENVSTVDELVSLPSQEGQTQTHR